MNLLELLRKSVDQNPNHPCLLYKQGKRYHRITYKEFWDTIREAALGLLACGVQPGDKVAILSTNCPQWAISDYAILSIGAVVVPIYPTLPAEQVEFILRNADVTCVLAEDANQLQKVTARWLQQLKLAVQFFGDPIASGKQVLTFADLCAIGKQRSPSLQLPDISAIEDGQLATIVHTSGTSGTPKGVMLTHANIVSNIQASLTCLPVKATDVGLSFLPLSHIFERTVGQYAVLSCGATIAYAESIEKIQANLREVRPTVFLTVPRLLEKVYAGIQQRIHKIPRFLRRILPVGWLIRRKLRAGFGGRIRYIVSGGAGLAADIAEFFNRAGLPVYEGYGMTETAPVICANRYNEARTGTVGKPIPGVEIRLADDGELQVRGPNVMQGYYKAPEETAKTFTDDGWLRTGDIAEIEDGFVKIVDRKKNILVLATGKNVAPWPIENSITLSPYIAEAVLIGDRRTYVTCLLVPDFAALAPIAAEHNLGDDRHVWLQSEPIRALIRQEVIRASEKFADFERPKRAILLANELSMEAGDLTPTLKVRNKVILQKYGRQIEEMYAGEEYLPIFDQKDESAEKTGQPLSAAEQSGESGQGRKRLPIWTYAAAGILVGILVRLWMR